jgi:hypothetical protein
VGFKIVMTVTGAGKLAMTKGKKLANLFQSNSMHF